MAFRAAGTLKKNTGSGNLASVGLPAGHVANDILVLLVTAADNVVCSVDQSYTKKIATNGTTSVRQEVWWKRDGGSEVAPTVTHAAGNSAVAQIFAFSGCITTGDPFSAASAQNNNGSATVTAPTITPGNSEDCIFVGSACSNTDTSGAPITQASYSGTNPTYTERGDGEESTGSKEGAQAVATGTSNGTATGSRTSATTSGFAATAIDSVGAQLSLLQATTASGYTAPVVIPNPRVGPMALRHALAQRFRQFFGSVATGVTQTVAPNQINSTASVTAVVVATRVVTPAAINSRGTVTATVVKTAVLTPTANSVATVTCTLVATRRVQPATINGVSTVTGSVVVIRRIQPAGVNGVSTVTGTVVKTAVLTPAINSTAVVTATVTGSTTPSALPLDSWLLYRGTHPYR